MINFNGNDLKNYCIIRDIGRQILPSNAVTMVDIQGRDGSYFFKRKRQARVINVEVMIIGQTKAEIRNNARALGEVLDTDKPAPLRFEDQPGVVYQAIVSGDTDISEQTYLGTANIQFVCPDPYGYSETETETVIPTAGATLVNAGNAETFPRYEITFNQPSTFFSMITPDGVTLVGNPDQVDKISVPPYEMLLNDDANDLSNWTVNTGITIENGVVAGAVQAVTSKIQPTDYGTGANWHGPALKHSFGQEIQDFQVELQAGMFSDNTASIGQLEVYLLDINNQVIGVMRIRDTSPTYDQTHLQWRAGDLTTNNSMLVLRGYDTVNYNYYANTSVFMYIARRGTRWECYSFKYENGQPVRHYAKHIEFSPGEFDTKKLASVVVHFGANGTNPPMLAINMEKLKVFKFNTVTEIQIPKIFQPGDVLKIDTYNGKVLLNDMICPYLDPASRFPAIQPGSTQVKFLASDPNGVTVKAYHGERWK